MTRYIKEEEVFQRKFDKYIPESFALSIQNPNEIPEKLMDVFRFYGAKGIARSEMKFFPRMPTGHRPFSIYPEDKGKQYPGWKGSMMLRFEHGVDEFFDTRRREVSWDRAIEYLAPFLRRARKTDSRHFGAQYNFVVFARDLPHVRSYFRENDPVKTMNHGMMFYQEKRAFMSDWTRNRLPGLLMINPDAGSILIKNNKDVTREDRIALDIYKRGAREEDQGYIDSGLRDIYGKYGIDYDHLTNVSEYLNTSYHMVSVPNAWLLTDDRNIY